MSSETEHRNKQAAEEQGEDHHEWCPPLDPRLAVWKVVNRRAAMRLMGMSALAVAAGCGSTGKESTTSSSDSATATTTSLSASSSSVNEGTSVTLTATVSPSAATGTVKFYDDSSSLGSGTLSSGTATLSTSFSSTGTHSLTATYTGSTDYASSTSSAVSVNVTTATTCSETLEGEEGPYFVDDSASGYNRSNILTNLDGTSSQSGVGLTLTLYVFDTENSCAAMENVQVDIWHCNASGIYSAESSESTTDESWLRGYQITDSTGKVSFTTIIPGWYSGRTTHIHFRLRSTYDDSSSGATNTMQVFFDEDLIDTLATSVSPYDAEGTNSTTNATDRVYSEQEDGTTLLTLSGSDSAGYTASFNIYLPIATATSS
ncbi:Ig-like domain repeat protein [Silvibacterium sp.]|uniref:Ig-like domain repeat protein n=1 Tax=Silvibacterium sp. TaxID=1964179 RepID=UPI0039E44E3A